MPKDSTPKERYTPNATLVALGLKLEALKVLEPIERLVQIRQKVIDHTPLQKLKDAMITMLDGAGP